MDLFSRRRVLAVSAAALASAALAAGCSTGDTGSAAGAATPGGSGSAGGPLPLTVSIAPQAAFLQAVGGSHVDVTVMVPRGSEPATYEPTPQQVAALGRSRAYFSIGVPFEGAWLPRFRSAAPDLTVVDTTDGIDRGTLSGGMPDPHIWLAPRLVRTQLRTCASALADLDPSNAAVYRSGLDDYGKTVRDVDSALTDMLRPYRGTAFMIFHPVLNYFSDEYGLEPINIQAGGKEPSAQDMERLVRRGRSEHVSAVLVEPEFSQTASRTIADQLGVPVKTVDPLASDWAQNMRDIGTTLASSFASS